MSTGFLAVDPNAVKPGWIAFFVVLILLIATFLLWRNMNKQLRKIKVPHAAEFQQKGPGSPAAEPPEEPAREDDPPPAG